MKDPQADRLYKLEEAHFGKPVNAAALEDLTRALARICRRYKLKRIPLWTEHATNPFHGYFEDEGKPSLYIVLNEKNGGRNFATCMHEIAHYITDSIHPRGTVQDHGVEYCGVLRALLHHERLMSMREFDELATKHNVKWVPHGA